MYFLIYINLVKLLKGILVYASISFACQKRSASSLKSSSSSENRCHAINTVKVQIQVCLQGMGWKWANWPARTRTQFITKCAVVLCCNFMFVVDLDLSCTHTCSFSLCFVLQLTQPYANTVHIYSMRMYVCVSLCLW